MYRPPSMSGRLFVVLQQMAKASVIIVPETISGSIDKKSHRHGNSGAHCLDS